jgi:aminoglycoside phosphotransferase (APT) family kinase protein
MVEIPSTNKLPIDKTLVARLIEKQFPQWKHLVISPIAISGWDNKTFHLGIP